MGERFLGQCKRGLYALLTVVFLTAPVFGLSPEASPKEALILRRITEYWKDGDYGSVKRQIAHFLEKNPDTNLRDHLRAMLGDLYFQERDFRSALATYDLIGNSEIRTKTFFNHLQAKFEMREFLSVIVGAEKYLHEVEQNSTNRAVKVRYLLAESCFRHALKCKTQEDKVLYLKMAKPHYKVLSQSKYSDRILFPLAEIHRLLREDTRAATLYMKLSEKYPEHRERFLFQAAILQIKESRKTAIDTFYKVYEMGGKRSRLAAFNRLILLYQSERNEEYLSFFENVISLMPTQKVHLLKFYEGRCHYYLGDYSQAIMPLETFVTSSKGRSKEQKTALLLLVNCSRYLNDVALLERTLYAYKQAFPKDREVPKILMMHAQLCRESGDLTQALTDLNMLTEEYPEYEEAESVAYDHALLLSHTDRWSEARENFRLFIEKYPESEKKMAAWRHLLNCAMEEVKNPINESSPEAKAAFVEILHDALHRESILTEREKQQYSLVMIKCLSELGQYGEAIPHLEEYIADGNEPSFLSEAHLLKAICHQKLGHDPTLFVEHAEKALDLNENLSDREILHLELYNSYLAKGLKALDPENKRYFHRHAADHLYASNAWKTRGIKLENLLWLSNYYFQSARSGNMEDFERAKVLYTNLLGMGEENQSAEFSSETLYLESEALKFSHLLEINHQFKEQITLLEMLVKNQEEKQQLDWKMKRRSFLELAKALENDGQLEESLGHYERIVKTAGKITSVVNNTAELHKAKLEYSLLPQHQREGESPELLTILHTLKDLQIQKKLIAEPVHLEAALHYAEIRAKMSGEKPDIFFYKRMREDFHASEDPIAEEYTRLRELDPKKNKIFTAYMSYLDALLLSTQAKSAFGEGKNEKGIELKEAALEILEDLSKDKEALLPYLLPRVERAKIAITKNL
ncbi:MAG: hypothetical protein KR126chlam1_01112 [Chlamydiae bacterium]|nr:hypothetical protein [Chlamydiota bacterium]